MMRILTLLAFFFAGFGVKGVEAQQAKEREFELPAELDRKTRQDLQPILQKAADRGLPVKTLTAKAAEGVLRGVSGEKIVSAVRALEERLTTANLALAPASTADVIAGADALQAGVEPELLRSFRRELRDQSLAVPLSVLAHLVFNKIPQQKASDIVLQLLRRGVSPEQLLALRQGFNEDILKGNQAGMALEARAATVLATLGRDGSGGGTVLGASEATGASHIIQYNGTKGNKKRK